MIFTKTEVEGAFVIDPERHEDERGFFARCWCQHEFEVHGLTPRVVQCNISFNPKKGTLRGMHYQTGAYAEAKLIRCTMGGIYDVVVDLRPESPGFGRHAAVVLTPANCRMLYVPEGCAHGFLTTEEYSEVFYQMSEFYVPEAARGFRWNDPFFSIPWPSEIRVISDRDANYPDFQPSNGG